MVRWPICMLPDTRTHIHTHTVKRPNTSVNKTSHPQTSQSKRGPIVRRHAAQVMCSTADRIGSFFSSPQRPHRLRALPHSRPRCNGYRRTFPVLQRPEREADLCLNTKNQCNCTSTPPTPHALRTWTGTS